MFSETWQSFELEASSPCLSRNIAPHRTELLVGGLRIVDFVKTGIDGVVGISERDLVILALVDVVLTV